LSSTIVHPTIRNRSHRTVLLRDGGCVS
jgi:hypothetical protein